ncbi:MAG: hypothetical protein CMK07_00810 [Ponticaulis sp.]|nr:hypothetical protein [Ponticaulis sp.]
MLTPRFSLYLDGLRAFCAVLVLFSHWAYQRFTGGDYDWIRDHDLGGEAVTVFFVMSGLVIAATADRRRDEGLSLFAADRLSRMWSVAIPAIALTFLLDPIGAALAPEVYKGFYQPDQPVQRIIGALTFTNQSLGMSLRPGSNGPWWSLSYEVMYYALFACAVFLRGSIRFLSIGAIALFAGWKILLLMPSWLLGVALWKAVRSGLPAQQSRAFLVSCLAAPVLFYVMAHATGLPDTLIFWTHSLLGDRIWANIGFSDNFVWANGLAMLVTIHLYGVAGILMSQQVVSQKAPAKPNTGERLIRWLAGGSFALYLFHYPVLQFLGAVIPGETTDLWRQGLLLVTTFAIVMLLADVTERRRGGLRRLLRGIAQPSPALTKPAAET